MLFQRNLCTRLGKLLRELGGFLLLHTGFQHRGCAIDEVLCLLKAETERLLDCLDDGNFARTYLGEFYVRGGLPFLFCCRA